MLSSGAPSTQCILINAREKEQCLPACLPLCVYLFIYLLVRERETVEQGVQAGVVQVKREKDRERKGGEI